MALLNLVRVSTATTGVGALALGAAVTGFLDMDGAGAVDGQTYDYAVEDGSPVTQREIGSGAWDEGAATLTRTVRDSTNGGAAIDIVGPAQVIVTPNRATWRDHITSNRTYYVRTDGDDTNDGLSNTAGGAWATLQYAWDTICQTVDIGGYYATIQMADGTYDAPYLHFFPVGGLIKIQGNTSDKSAVVIDGSVTADNAGPSCWVHSVTFNGLFYVFGAGVNWYATAIRLVGPDSGFLADAQAVLNLYEPVTFTGSSYAYAGVARSICIQAINLGFIYNYHATHTIEDTPALSYATAAANDMGYIASFSTTWSGSATGKRYIVDSNSLIETSGAGANYFPGNSAGTTATGGQYL